MREHPYTNLQSTAFWSRSVSKDFRPSQVVGSSRSHLPDGAKVVSAGSCFAANLVPFINSSGRSYIKTEEVCPSSVMIAREQFGYSDFSAAYGNIYTARQMRQLLERAIGIYMPMVRFWREGEQLIDPFRPGLRYRSRSEREFSLITEQHLSAVRSMFSQATHFVFTLGLIEGWVNKADGAIYPAAPGTVAGVYDPTLHAPIKFTVNDVIEDLRAVIRHARWLNENIEFIFTVSPVPLVATHLDQHVLLANSLSKATLRVAVESVIDPSESVSYFPAYELITGPQADPDFFMEDRRSVSPRGVEYVMNSFLGGDLQNLPLAEPAKNSSESELSTSLIYRQCEELMTEA